jgi:polyferredoxin
VVHIVNVLSLRFPPFLDHIAWYLVLLFGVATAVFLGRLYCGWVCPFGAVQELLKRIVPYRAHLSPNAHRSASQLRMVLLWLVVCLVIIGGSQEVLRYEPFAVAFGLRGTVLLWAILAVVLLASPIIDRFWCRYFCAVGASLHLLGKLGLRKSRSSSPSEEQVVGDF